MPRVILDVAPTGPIRNIRLARPPAAALDLLLLASLVVLCYRAWVQPGLISAGDFPYVTGTYLKEAIPLPALWDGSQSTGGYNILQAPMFPLLMLQGILSLLHVDWTIIERLIWVYPAVAIPCVSTYLLALRLLHHHRAALVGALAATMNSYVFLLYEGGQFGVAIGFGFMPLVLWGFARGRGCRSLAGGAVMGLIMSIQAFYDIRPTYISLGLCVIYGLCAVVGDWARRRPPLRSLLPAMGLPRIALSLLVLAVLHSWWILPALLVHAPALPPGYTSLTDLHQLSFMRLSNAVSLFHPFWLANDQHLTPINPLFFAVPLVAFSMLLGRRYSAPVLFLTVTALLAAFLVKGSNDPAGAVYEWLFGHLPGFSLFRDPSKFYQPLAVAYGLLLGLAATACRELAGRRRRPRQAMVRAAVTVGFVIVAMFPAYPALLQQARGTLVANPVPAEYARFNDIIDRQSGFFRVLWVPARPRFGTFSALHPALDAVSLGACCSDTRTREDRWWWLASPSAPVTLQALSVRYVVVPDDVYSVAMRPLAFVVSPPIAASAAVAAIRHFLPRLHESMVGHLHVFTASAPAPLLYAAPTTRVRHVVGCRTVAFCAAITHAPAWIDVVPPPTSGLITGYHASASRYDVRIRSSGRPFYLVLQQTYDPDWIAYAFAAAAPSSPWDAMFATPLPAADHVVANGYANAWLIHRAGRYRIVIAYWPQRLVVIGFLIALVAVLSFVGLTATRAVRWRTRVPGKSHVPHKPATVSRC